MAKFIAKKILMLIPTLFAVVFIVFCIMELTPGNPVNIMLGPNALPEAYEELTQELGLDQPFHIRYINYMVDLLQGDMGKSWVTGRDVFSDVIQRIPVTFKLASFAIILSILIGIPLGILAAVKQYSLFDFAGTSTAMILAALPSFWFGMIAIIVFSLKLGWFPSNGSDTWLHYILPAFTLGLPEAAILLRHTRTMMLETIRQDYIRTARAKGQVEKKVIFRHALKNAILPVITVAGMDFGYLLGGAVVTESVFSLNGAGGLVLDAITKKDVPLAAGCTLVFSGFFMLVLVLVDIAYAFIDPRIKARYKRGG